jgi:hypothetical protein
VASVDNPHLIKLSVLCDHLRKIWTNIFKLLKHVKEQNFFKTLQQCWLMSNLCKWGWYSAFFCLWNSNHQSPVTTLHSACFTLHFHTRQCYWSGLIFMMRTILALSGQRASWQEELCARKKIPQKLEIALRFCLWAKPGEIQYSDGYVQRLVRHWFLCPAYEPAVNREVIGTRDSKQKNMMSPHWKPK